MRLIENGEAPAISPDSTRMAFVRRDNSGFLRIVVVPLDSLRDVRVLTHADDGLWDHRSPAWSPDGKTICYAAQRNLWLVPAAGGEARRLTTEGEWDVNPEWAPDGQFVYFDSFRDGVLALWRVLARGGSPERLTHGSGPESEPSLSADRTRLVYSTRLINNDIVVLNRATGDLFAFGGERDEGSPAFLPDRSAVIYVSDAQGGRYQVWRQPLSPQGAPIGAPSRLTDQPGGAAHPSVSPDGRWIAYYRTLDELRDIWIISTGGGAPIRVTRDGRANVLPEWSPDGRSIAYVSDASGQSQLRTVRIEDGHATHPPQEWDVRPLAAQAVAWSPDSDRLVFVGTDAAGSSDVWQLHLNGSDGPSRLTSGGDVQRVTCTERPGEILASGNWGTHFLTLKRIHLSSGEEAMVGSPSLFGTHGRRGEFALSKEGVLLAAVRQIASGNVWMLEAVRGRF